MGPIERIERETYQEVYGVLGQYGTDDASSPGVLHLPRFLDAIGDVRGTVLDAGCGAGRGSLALAEAGFTVYTCDLLDVREPAAQMFPFGEACLWQPLRPAIRRGTVDWVYCCDVLEHLPTQFVGLALSHLLSVALRGVFVAAHLHEDHLGVLVGKPLHQTVKPYRWWKTTCEELAAVTDARDLGTHGCFLLEPRR